MNFNRYSNLVEATNDLTKRGFSHSFNFEEGTMVCLKDKTKYQSNDMKILELHRFEGLSNPADNSVIFAIKCKDGKKGMVIASYGADAEKVMTEFMQKVEVSPEDSAADLARRTKGSSRK